MKTALTILAFILLPIPCQAGWLFGGGHKEVHRHYYAAPSGYAPTYSAIRIDGPVVTTRHKERHRHGKSKIVHKETSR